MADYVLDEFDAFGGGVGLPVPSWDTLGIGGVVEGIILPQKHPKNGQLVSYISTQQTKMPTADNPNPEPLWYDDEHTRPRMQAEFHLMTTRQDFEDCSEARKAAALENEEVDEGLRRAIVKGKTATNSSKKSAAKVFRANQGRPVIGAYFKMVLVKKQIIKGSSFKENIIEVTYRAPDDNSLRVVREYVAENFDDDKPAQDTNDAFGAGSNVEDTEPDF